MKQRHISNSSSLSGWNCFFTEDLQSSGGDGTVFSHLCVSSFPGQELLTYIHACEIFHRLFPFTLIEEGRDLDSRRREHFIHRRDVLIVGIEQVENSRH